MLPARVCLCKCVLCNSLLGAVCIWKLADGVLPHAVCCRCACVSVPQYCVNNQLPRLFDNSSMPSWSMSPSYYHYLGRTAGNYIVTHVMPAHGVPVR